MKDNLKYRIAVARGSVKPDLVLKNARVVNVFSGEVYETDVAVAGETIAGLGSYDGKKNIDCASKFLLPGFIDSHVHLESSLVSPSEYARAALASGTTAVIADPHEIANVLGKQGITAILRATARLPLDFYFMLPSCVPASPLDTSGARLDARDLLPFLGQERVLGLAEMMNYSGVVAGDSSVLKKLSVFAHRPIDGHSPGVTGKNLSAYVGTGISSDHECMTAAEAREKLRLGMIIFIRESSAAKNLSAILPAVTPQNERFFCFATDDLQPADLQKGSLDTIIKKAIRLGLDPVSAVRMATINPAHHFQLKNRGAIAPGYRADMVVINNFRTFTVEMVFKNGQLLARNGNALFVRAGHRLPATNTVKAGPISIRDIALKSRTGHARVIELVPDQIETRQRIMPVIVDNGMVANDRDRDVAKMVVLERHTGSGRIGIGLVKGFGLRAGAFASTVAHDSHNIIAVGMYDEDIVAAVQAIRKMRGGLVAVYKKKVIAMLPLPLAGLMSDRPLDTVVRAQSALIKAVQSLGVKLKAPFATLSFLALPVIPELKLTDRGLVDVKQAKYVDLFV